MDKMNIPTDEQVNDLMSKVLQKRGITLNPMQESKFKHACVKCFVDNPDADFNGLMTAANVYLNLILDFPDMTL